MRRLPLVLLLCLLSGSLCHGENWPQFRGPTGMGVCSQRELPTTWGGKDDTNVLWKVDLPGTAEKAKADQNQSSPIVWGDRLFLTVTYWPADAEAGSIPQQHVACYQTSDGKMLWDSQVAAGPWKLSDLRGGYSAPTPATDGERVYVVFGSAVVAALDFEGKLVWEHPLANFESFDVAIASSPIVYQGQVIVLADKNNQKATLTAYDAKTGEVKWEQPRPNVAFAHSTPVIAKIGGREQMLVAASNALQGLNPADGHIQWWVSTPGDVCSPTIAPSNSMVYTDSGRGGPAMLVDPSGAGDVTASNVQWKIGNIPEGLSSPVIVGGHIYRLHNPGVLKCIDLASGKDAYAKRLDGVSTAASPITTPDGRVYFASSGKSYVIQAGPSYELLSTNDLGDESSASVAVSGGRLFFKGKRQLYCVGSKP